jgi:hypothetical protein
LFERIIDESRSIERVTVDREAEASGKQKAGQPQKARRSRKV